MADQVMYVEHDNVIFRGRKDSRVGNIPFFDEMLVGGQWKDAGILGSDARHNGMTMTEDEAREFAGDEWPKDDAAAEPAPDEPPPA